MVDAQPNLAAVAALIGDPARSAMLGALLGGQALPAGELAHVAHVSPQTASAHLSKLIEGKLLLMTRSGRHRYYRIASSEIASALEALALIAPPQSIRCLRDSQISGALRLARTCYVHLAGVLGVTITRSMLDQGLLERTDSAFTLTSHGEQQLVARGVDVAQARSSRR